MKTKTRIGWMILALALLVGLMPRVQAAPRQMPITFGGYTNRTEALTNFPVLVVLSNNVGQNFTFNDFVPAANGYDLRFYTNSTDTGDGLDYEIELWNTNAASYVWVRVPLIPTNGSGSIYAKWGKTATSNQLACTTNGAVWTNGYVGVWHLTNGVTLSARDSTTNNNHGTVNSATATNGVVDGAASFTDSSSVNVSLPSLSLGTTHTLEFWIRYRDTGDAVVIGGDTTCYAPYIAGSGSSALMYYKASGNYVSVTSGGFSSTQWNHITIARSEQSVTFYKDGLQLGATQTLSANTAQILARLSGFTSGTFSFLGELDEVRMGSIARSSNWVWASYANMASNTLFNRYGEAMPVSPYKLPMAFTNYTRAEVLTNFPVLVTFSNGLYGTFNYTTFKAPATGGDLRFMDSTESAFLDFEIESWNTNGASYAWVRVPQLNSNTTIYAKWGGSDTTLPACTTNGAVWTNGFVGVWHLATTNGGLSVLDSTANNNIATNNGSVPATNGIIAGGATFDNTDTKYMGLPPLYLGASSATGGVTMSLWLKYRDTGNGMILGGVGSRYPLWIDGPGSDKKVYWSDGAYSANVGHGGLNSTEWYHMAIIVGAPTVNSLAFYKNGALLGEPNGVIGQTLTRMNGSGYPFLGELDEVRLQGPRRSVDWLYAEYLNVASNAFFNGYGSVVSLGGSAPVVTNAGAVTITMAEDGTFTPVTIGATDADGDTLTWTNGAVAPLNGTVDAINVVSSNLTSYTYRPATNWNGTNTFSVKVSDGNGGEDSCMVTVVVTAVNDVPVNTVAPGYDGATTFATGTVWTVTDGTWNDYADTNAVYDGGGLTFAYQWYCSNSPSIIITDATNATFTPGSEWLGSNLAAAVSCIDTGYPGAATGTVFTAWREALGAPNTAPVIYWAGVPETLATTNMTEDGGTLQLTNLALTATDADGDPITWTNVAGTGPANGTVSVQGSGTNVVTWTSFSYTPNANFNGTNEFVVQAWDGKSGTASITVQVAVAAVNDTPVNTVLPGFAGAPTSGVSLAVTNGVWNDNADTNAAYTAEDFLTQARFTYQWRRADDSAGTVNFVNLANQTNATYTPTKDDRYKYLSAQVTCTDSNYPVGSPLSYTTNTAWVLEASVFPTLVVFTNALGDGAWGSYSNWAPDTAPATVQATNTTAVVGDANVKAVVEAQITGAAYAKSLYVGTNAGSGGTVTMTGGTLTFPAPGVITVAGQSSSTGTLNQTGGSIGGITSGDLTIASGTGSKGTVVLGGSSAITSGLAIASATGASGTFTLTNSARWQNTTAADRNIGSAANAAGSLNVYGNGYVDLANKSFNFGTAWGSTGVLRVADSGVVTNAVYIRIGQPGYGDAVVSGTGKVYATVVDMCSTGGAPCSLTVRDSGFVLGLNMIGRDPDGLATVTLSNNATANGWASYWTVVGAAARSTGRLYVRDNAVLRLPSSSLSVGGGNVNGIGQPNTCTGMVEVSEFGVITNLTSLLIGYYGYGEMTVSGTGRVYATAVDLCSTGGVPCSLTVRDSGYVSGLYRIGRDGDGIATVTLSNNATATGWSGQKTSVGSATRSTGRLYVRDNAVFGFASATPVYIGEGVNSTGIVEIAGSGVFTNCSSLSVGYGSASVGKLDLLGGKLHQAGALNVGTTAGATGLVTVANCAQTNITGAVTVGSGAAGDRYGSVTISNATFGGGTALTVTNNGSVTLTGTGSVLRINTLTVNGGTVTNRVRALAGGPDLTNSVNTALAVTGGIHLSFEGNSDALPPGPFWGLRWAGTNGYPVLTNGMATGAITVTNQMTGAFSNQTMTVFKAGDNSYTFIGFMNAAAPVINDGATGVETNMNEDGIVYLTNLLWASDADGTSWAWTNVTGSGPANGTVAVNGSGTNPVNWSVFTYTPNANFNGTNSFQVRVTDDALLTDSITVTVVVAAVNDAPTNTTAPGISGSGQYGTPWTATNGVWNDNADTNAAYTHAVFTNGAGFAYQWQYSNDVNIAADATNAVFVPSAAMAGTNIRVRVTCTDGGEGTPGPQSATGYSAYVTVTVPTNDPPANTTPPGISGNSAYGSVWTATNGVWNDNSDTNVHYTHADFTNTSVFTYQWQYSNATPDNILNETNATFTTTQAMLGTNIRVMVTCTDAGYGVPASTSTVVYSAYKPVTAPSLLIFNKASDAWTSIANWTPSVMPSAGTPAVIGDTNIVSPAEAQIGGSDTAEVKDLYLGTNTSSKGTLTMTGGTLTFPAAGNITVAGASSSTGTLNQTGGTLSGITSGTLTIGSGASSVGAITLGNDSSITSAVVIASASGASGALTLTNSARWMNTAADRNIGSAAGAAGSLNVHANGYADLANRSITFGSAWGGTGLLRVADSGVVTNMNILSIGNPGYGDAVVSGAGKVYASYLALSSTGGVASSLTVRDSGYASGLYYVGYPDGTSTVTLSNNATASGPANYYTCIGVSERSTGRFYVRDNARYDGTGKQLFIGGGLSALPTANDRTGVVEVSDFGVITNCSSIWLGYNGAAQMTVSGTGKVYVSVALSLQSTGAVPCSLTVTNAGYVQGLYRIGGADGAATATLAGDATGTACTSDHGSVGHGDRSIGRLYVRNNAYYNGSGLRLSVGSGVGSTGIVEVSGNAVFTNCSTLNIGSGSNSVGKLDLTGGKLHQAGALNVGTAAGATGLVTVANCAQTDISGAVTVGGGTTPGDRCGSVTISNATFGGGTAVTVWTNGFVELTGTGSVLRCSTFTANGGAVTNYVRDMSGGIDVTGATLVITNGGTMRLVFGDVPATQGEFWGLRWAGNNHAGQLQGMTNSGLSWDDAALAGNVKIYTNATHTMVGYVSPASGATFRFR